MRTRYTPGCASAREVSTRTTRACGIGERSSRACAIRGSTRSSANLVCPVTLARPSTRRRGWPMTFMAGLSRPRPPRDLLIAVAPAQVADKASRIGREWDEAPRRGAPWRRSEIPACNTRTALRPIGERILQRMEPPQPRLPTVTTCRPSHSTPSTRHESTGWPSRSTAQAPHSPSSQPCFVPHRLSPHAVPRAVSCTARTRLRPARC